MSIKDVIVHKFNFNEEEKENVMFNVNEIMERYSNAELKILANAINEHFEIIEAIEEVVEPVTCTMALNEELGGIEITFNDKPTDEIRERLKANNYRWHSVRKIWYAKNTENTLALAKELCA